MTNTESHENRNHAVEDPLDVPTPQDSGFADDNASLGADAVPGAEEPKSELDIQKDKYLRLAAEYDNYRKRTAKELQAASARGQGDLLRGMLDTLDDLVRFAQLDPAATDTATVVQGLGLIEKNLFKTLSGIGLEVIDPVGQPFDPAVHEALSTVSTDVASEDQTVAQVYQRGYVLKGQLLRPARVVVKQHS